MSDLDDSHCPSFMYDGPSEMKVFSAFCACFLNFPSFMFLPSFRTHSLRSLLSLIMRGMSLKIVLMIAILDGLLYPVRNPSDSTCIASSSMSYFDSSFNIIIYFLHSYSYLIFLFRYFGSELLRNIGLIYWMLSERRNSETN